MSKIALTPNASGTGTFTIASPNSNTDRTLTLPDAAGTVFLENGSGTIAPTNISDGTLSIPTTYVTNGSAKAWVNFDGTAGTLAPRDSLNVSSLTDNGTGDHTISFTNAFGAADYCFTTALGFTSSSVTSLYNFTVKPNGTYKLSGSFRGESAYVSSTADRTSFDFDEVNISCAGDLA